MELNGIYYESRGSGPLLLFIAGGNGDAGPFAPTAQLLADRFTTVAYDRRGFSRSAPGSGSGDRLAQDSADAAMLIEQLGDGPAYVFGSSSGAIVGLDLATRRPDLVRAFVCHEPPLLHLLPDGDEWLAFLDEVHAEYQANGAIAAMAKFNARIGAPPPMRPAAGELPPHVVELIERMNRNLDLFLETELRQYTRYAPDFDALGRISDRILLVGGAAGREFVPYRPNLVIADWLGSRVTDLPGDHIGYATSPAEFAPALAALLSAH